MRACYEDWSFWFLACLGWGEEFFVSNSRIGKQIAAEHSLVQAKASMRILMTYPHPNII